MRLRMTGRHVNLTPALKRYIEQRMQRLDRYGIKLRSLQVLIGVEKFRHTAEAIGTISGRRVQAKTSTGEMYASIDQLVDKLDAQLRKLKGRLVSHKPGNVAKRSAVVSPVAAVAGPDQVEVVRPPLQRLSVEEALALLAESPTGVVVFLDALTGRMQVLQRDGHGRIALIDPERVPGRTADARS